MIFTIIKVIITFYFLVSFTTIIYAFLFFHNINNVLGEVYELGITFNPFNINSFVPIKHLTTLKFFYSCWNDEELITEFAHEIYTQMKEEERKEIDF